MSRWLILSLLSICTLSAGCSMCCGPYDYEYPMLHEANYVRMDPEYGRVGSIYSDPNANMSLVAPLTNKDVPRTDNSPGDDEGEDDPNFNRDLEDPLEGQTDPDAEDLDIPSVQDGDVDTSARVPRRQLYDRNWR